MICRQCQGIEKLFNQRQASKDLNGYRKRGPSKTTQMLVDAIKAEGVEGRTVLDIGGGVGVIQHELLKAGASSCVAVEASTAYIQAAREEAERQGHTDRVVHRHGDFADIAEEIEAADIVTLDRVICCYHDVEKLVGLSSQRASKLFCLVYPRAHWGSGLVVRLFNAGLWLMRNKFRAYIHSSSVVDALVKANGLKQHYYGKTFIWQVVVYGR